jgi:hypothetical protein
MTIADILADRDQRFTVRGMSGVAFYAYKAETKPDADTIWTGIENPTGRVIMVMVGDDREYPTESEDITPIPDDAYCSGCGQIGCHAYG